jgi:hypothetical protein
VTLSKQTSLLASGKRKPFPCECTHEWKRCTEPVRFDKRTRGPGIIFGRWTSEVNLMGYYNYLLNVIIFVLKN